MKHKDEASAIGKIFKADENKLHFFNTTNEELLDGDIWHPKMPMVPAAIGLKIVMRPTTPWELIDLIADSRLEWFNEVKELLLPVACWAFSAAIKGTQPAVSSMLFLFNTMMRPSKCLGRRM